MVSSRQASSRRVLFTWAFLSFFSTCPGLLLAQYGGGSGVAGDPYLINSPTHLLNLRDTSSDWGKHFKLTKDIDMEPYLLSSGIAAPFTGSFDGGGHEIHNFKLSDINTPGSGLFALFGSLDNSQSEIKNLGLIKPVIDAGMSIRVAALVGDMRNGNISNCYVISGSITGGYFGVGGLVGNLRRGTIRDCYANCNVTGTGDDVGGLVGRAETETAIINSYVKGNIRGDERVGGLVGLTSGIIRGCFANGTVTGDSQVGGLVGRDYNGFISNCYATNKVTGTAWVGGLFGYSDLERIDNTFWDINTGGPNNSYGIPLSTAQMQTQSSFTDYGWDFMGEQGNGAADIWRMCVDGISYPRLRWEYDLFGDWVCPDGVSVEDLVFLTDWWMVSLDNELPVPDLIGRWKLNESSGLMATDSIGSHHGTLINYLDDDSQWTAGILNNALDFDGANENYLSLPSNIIDPSSAFSVFVWVKLVTKNGISTQVIFQQEGPLGRALLSRNSSNDKLRSYFGATATESNSAVFFLTDQWRHLGMTYDGITMKLYVDGVEEASNIVTGESETSGFRIGSHKTPSPELANWDGLVDDLRIYDRALTAEEIVAIASLGPYSDADLTYDGVTDYTDFSILSANWIPEI